MIASPPLKPGAVHVKRTDWLKPTPTGEPGAAGTLFGAATKLTEYAMRFGVPDPALVMTPRVAPLLIAAATAAGEEVGFCCKYKATTPATWGAAIDVPDIEVTAVLEEIPADVID